LCQVEDASRHLAAVIACNLHTHVVRAHTKKKRGSEAWSEDSLLPVRPHGSSVVRTPARQVAAVRIADAHGTALLRERCAGMAADTPSALGYQRHRSLLVGLVRLEGAANRPVRRLQLDRKREPGRLAQG
jgi:hypothetical protein